MDLRYENGRFRSSECKKRRGKKLLHNQSVSLSGNEVKAKQGKVMKKPFLTAGDIMMYSVLLNAHYGVHR